MWPRRELLLIAAASCAIDRLVRFGCDAGREGGTPGGPSPTNDVAVVDRPANQRPCAGADDRPERLRSTRSDDVAKRATGDTTKDEANGAVVAFAVVAVVRAPVDAIVSVQWTRTVASQMLNGPAPRLERRSRNRNRVFDTNTAVKTFAKRPIVKVVAKPLIGLVPN